MSEHNNDRRPHSRHNNGHRPQNRHNNRPNYGSNERKKQGIRGHDAALYGMVRGEEQVMVFLNSSMKLPLSGESKTLVGKIVQYDAYTVTMELEHEKLKNPLILFKSNIGGLTKLER